MAYASGTSVPIERTASEIERLLARAGASQFVRGWSEGRAALGFTLDGRQVRIELPLPERSDVTRTGTGRLRSPAQVDVEMDRELRRRWRALLMVIKAKLVSVEDGISTIEREFMADVVLPNGKTLGEWVAPQLDAAYQSGGMPALMPGGNE